VGLGEWRFRRGRHDQSFVGLQVGLQVGLGEWRFRRGRHDQSFVGLQGEIFGLRENVSVYGWQAAQPPCPLVYIYKTASTNGRCEVQARLMPNNTRLS
jgi:hypothetical protein